MLLSRERDLKERGQQFYQPASALEMDVLRSHHLVSSPGSGTDYRKPDSQLDNRSCVEFGCYRLCQKHTSR
jgi:hypothetical protein